MDGEDVMRIGINGMGRMGRLALRASLGGILRSADDPRARNRLEIAHVNETKGGAEATAHLLEFDSIHGRGRESFEVMNDTAIVVGGTPDRLHQHAVARRHRGRMWAIPLRTARESVEGAPRAYSRGQHWSASTIDGIDSCGAEAL